MADVKSLDSGLDLAEAGGAPKMKRCLGVLDMVFLGISCIIGAGIFILTGRAAREFAGPAIIVSYAIAGGVAFITATVYCEFGSEVSVTGGSYIYSAQVFGTPVAWIVGSSILFEYVFTAAAVAKGFTSYLMQLAGYPTEDALIHIADHGAVSWDVDLVALSIVIIFTVLLIFNVKGASWANTIITAVALVVIAFTIIAGFINFNSALYQPFAPFGMKGILTGASRVCFAYIGYDMIGLAAEETANPGFDVPVGVGLSTIVCTVLYMLMSAVIPGLVPYQQIATNAPFSQAFKDKGMDWAARLISVGALCAIADTVIANLYAMSRLLVVLGRFRVIPKWLSAVHPKLHIPLWGQLVTLLITGILATFFPLEELADIVSMGTLIAMYTVCLGCIWRRYYQADGPTAASKLYPAFTGIFISTFVIGFTYDLSEDDGTAFHPYPHVIYIIFGLMWLASTGSLHAFPIIWEPSGFKVPAFPWLPSFGAGACMLLIATLGKKTWKAWGYATLAFLGLWLALKIYEYVTQGLAPSHWFDPDDDLEEDYQMVVPRINWLQAPVEKKSSENLKSTTVE